MKSYLQQLRERSEEVEVDLLHAFKAAGIPTSTYYRAINGDTDLRFETADRVMDAIERINNRTSAEIPDGLQHPGRGVGEGEVCEGL